MYKLKVIIASTRPTRKGPAVAKWFAEIAKQYEEFNTKVIDLKEIDLPFLDEPDHPKLGHYRNEHTKRWSKLIDEADAYVFVTSEYNYGFPATLKNAIDYLHNEWKYKPVGIVAYGGIAAGTRATQMLKQVVTTLSMMPIFESVNIPFLPQHLDEKENFVEYDAANKSAHSLMKGLLPWTEALKGMREKMAVAG